MSGSKQKWIALLLALGLAALGGLSLWNERRNAPQPDEAMEGWQEYTVYWFDVFDTVTRVVGYAPSQEEWTRQMDALHEDLVAYHQLFDIYNSYEGVTSLKDVNEQAGSGPVQVDERTFEMLSLAKEMYTVTNGKLNVAMGDVLSLWHDYREEGLANPDSAQLPPQEELEEAAAHGSIQDLILDEEACTVQFADPQLQLDVGSVGKGYAVEQAARAAEARGATSLFISVGGNLRAIGHRADGRDWIGGVQDPWNLEDTLCSVNVQNGESLVTSGDYLRYYTVDGKRYCHLVDPDTLYPAERFLSLIHILKIGGGNFAVMSGPCSVESEAQIVEVARRVQKAGASLLRGGAFKPRTSPYSFQGLRAEGLELMRHARAATGQPIVTELMNTEHLPLFEDVDMIQIGARNMQNFELLKAVGRQKKPVLLKRGLSATLEEFVMSAEYIMAEGNEQVVLCERGIRTFEKSMRNTLDISAVPMLKKMTHLPVVIDPSHAAGLSWMVEPLAKAAVAVGADGLMIEVHDNPAKALSDGAQSLDPDQFDALMAQLRPELEFFGKTLN